MAIYLDGRVVVNGENAGFLNIQNPKDLAILLYQALTQNDSYAQLTATLLNGLITAMTASNGLTLASNNVKLGGNLSENTAIDIKTFGMAIGDSATVDASAVLNIQATNKGFKVPVMSTAQRNAIASPSKGLIVYSTTDDKFYGYNGTTWVSLS